MGLKKNAIPPNDTDTRFYASTMQATLSFGNSLVKRSPLKSKGNILTGAYNQLAVQNRMEAAADHRIGRASYEQTMHPTRVWCMMICECCSMTRPPTKNRERMMKVEAAADNGSDVQDSTKESAHDSSDGIDSYLFH